MAPTKKSKSTKKVGPDLSNRTLSLEDLPKTEQRDAESLVSRVSETMPQQFEKLAHSLRNATIPTQVSARKKYEKAAPQAVEKPITIESMAKNRSDSFMRGLTGQHRLPQEDYTGQEFYFKHRGEIDEIRSAANTPDIDLGRVLGATARLSVRTTPEGEKASAKGLLGAHARGSVNFHPDMVNALATAKHAATVPEELHGKQVPFSTLPSNIVKAMVDPKVRSQIEPHVSDVNIGEISKSSMASNISEAHKTLQGTNLPNPKVNPKQFSYQSAHELAVPNSPEHGEFKMRAMNLGQVARGEQSPNQLMFDFHGLRDSNEGVLSNKLTMPEDSWMNAISYDQPAAIKKAAGDVTLGTKKGTTKRGRELSVGAGNKDITPLGIQHAVNSAATSRAAKDVQETLGVGYTVPAMMIQEGDWAETRRAAGADAPYNATIRKTAEKAPKKPKSNPTLF